MWEEDDAAAVRMMVDEIGMVSATHLADVDTQLRGTTHAPSQADPANMEEKPTPLQIETTPA